MHGKPGMSLSVGVLNRNWDWAVKEPQVAFDQQTEEHLVPGQSVLLGCSESSQ